MRRKYKEGSGFCQKACKKKQTSKLLKTLFFTLTVVRTKNLDTVILLPGYNFNGRGGGISSEPVVSSNRPK
jgi:hypothetical protein